MASWRSLVLLASVAMAVPVNAAKSAAPIPDFSGVWAHASIPGVEPLPSGPTSLKNLSRRDGGVSNNMQLVGDYRNPILKPEAAAIVKKFGDMSRSGIGYPTPRNQCWPGGVPFVLPTNGFGLLQRGDHITIIYAVDHQVRHVRMNQPHPAQVTPSWYGDSVGHYEGDTLVIDTVGVKIGPYAMIDWFGTPHSPALHVVERYRLLSYDQAKEGLERDASENYGPRNSASAIEPYNYDPDYRGKHLQLRFTVDDKAEFTTPWSATVTYGHPLGEWKENVCAENPFKYGTEKDAAVPTAKRPDF
ncbi:MAG TPA: hypothetical protein VFW28_01660 [Micropepsaceae bacterium]|nr:hypothetical protein [Micropepsaceae bacterium]